VPASLAFPVPRATVPEAGWIPIMDKFVAKANIEHFRRKLAQETDETKRQARRACWLRKKQNWHRY
jgi:hypothetical protein